MSGVEGSRCALQRIGKGAWLAGALVALCACEDASSGNAGLLGILAGSAELDAATDAAVASDAGDASADAGPTDDAGSFDLGAAAIAGEVLTNRAEIGFVDHGEQDLVIVTASVRRALSGDDPVLWVLGDLENRGSVARCLVIADDFYVDRYSDAVVMVQAPPYRRVGSHSGISADCIAPGERGVFSAIVFVPEHERFETVREIGYALSGFAEEPGDFEPHPDAAILLTVDRYAGDDGYLVFGKLRSATAPVHELTLTFFARDDYGLLVDQTFAFVNGADTVPASSTLDYTSEPFRSLRAEPEAITAVQRFTEGARDESASLAYDAAAPSAWSERLARKRRTQLAWQAAFAGMRQP